MIFNLGSINVDYVYQVPHLPKAGETLFAQNMSMGLGGKGANQSVAAARAGREVRHIGAIGPSDQWVLDRLTDNSVGVDHVRKSTSNTGHAIIAVDRSGENQIIVHPGANLDQDVDLISQALAQGGAGDWLLLQNETSHQVEAAKLACAAGLKVAYSAAPFDVASVERLLPYMTLLMMNEVEAQQFQAATGSDVRHSSLPYVLVTKGKAGAELVRASGAAIKIAAFDVPSVDTTGAGDTFAGYTVAGLEEGLSVEQTLLHASAAAALSTTKEGTADAIPTMSNVLNFLRDQDANGAFVPHN